MQDWQCVGRILVKGYTDLKYFPLTLSKSFVILAFFGEKRKIKKAIDQEILTEEDRNDAIDIISTLSSRRTFHTNAELKSLLTEIAHKEIVQAPSYIKEPW